MIDAILFVLVVCLAVLLYKTREHLIETRQELIETNKTFAEFTRLVNERFKQIG